MLALGGGSGVNLIFPEVIRQVINADLEKVVASNLPKLALLLAGLFIFQGLCFFLRHYFFAILGQKIVASVRSKLFKSILDKGIDFFDSTRVGDLISRLSSDTVMIQDAVSLKLSVLVRYSLQVIVGLILMTWISLELTGVAILIIPLLVVISRHLGKQLRYWSRQQQEALGITSSVAEEVFSGVRIVKAFGMDVEEGLRYQHETEKVLKIGLNRSRVAAFFSSFVSLLMNLSLVGVLLYGISRVISGSMPAGDLAAFLMYGAIVAVSFAFVVSGYSEFVQALGASDRIVEFLQPKTILTSKKLNYKTLKNGLGGDITFNNVSFYYPSRPSVEVLQNLSLKIATGKITALVGRSGSGKTTLINLILQFYNANAGEILFDGIEASLINPLEIRSQIALVPQDPVLFDISIAENVKYGKQSASLDEIMEACKKANIFDFIASLPNGFDTLVGQRGIQLSQGQKQRISIARAILRDPKILILDEATSALDSENEALIQSALEKIMKDRTTIVIAHRLATIKNADRLYVLDGGRVIQEGIHDTLSREPGLYKQLVDRQELFESKS